LAGLGVQLGADIDLNDAGVKMTVVRGTRLDSGVPIAVLEPLRTANAALLELLDGLAAEDWHRPTVHKDRSVKDLTAHLLHGSIRRVSSMRDRYQAPTAPSFSTAADLTRFIQGDNRTFMNGMDRVSPQIICELIRR
jgi:Mycothiol maleylpyruvate isomerase N-terminal domain